MELTLAARRQVTDRMSAELPEGDPGGEGGDLDQPSAAEADQAIPDAGLAPKAIGATGASDTWVLSQNPFCRESLVSLGSTVVINVTDAYGP
jgi:hypothetical protein